MSTSDLLNVWYVFNIVHKSSVASYSVLVSDEYESQHKQSFNRVYTVGIAVHQAGTHLSTGTHLHTFQRRKQISSHHRGESLPLSLQLRVTVHEKTHLCDRSTHSCTLAALLRMIWIKQEEDGNIKVKDGCSLLRMVLSLYLIFELSP